jgi:RNA polymerase sigma-70 factor (ECF subfamily)
MRQAIVLDLLPLLTAKGATPPVSDEVLVGRALEGDRAAEEAIYRRHANAVANLAARMLRSRADAEDVLQETFAIALDRLDQVRDPAALKGWLLGIATSQVRRRFRRRKLLDVLGFDRNADDATLERCASDDADPETRLELAKLERVLSGVSFEPRLAWMLRHVEGHTLPEIAAALGCSLATAKRRLAEADAAVRAHVDLHPDDSSPDSIRGVA